MLTLVFIMPFIEVPLSSVLVLRINRVDCSISLRNRLDESACPCCGCCSGGVDAIDASIGRDSEREGRDSGGRVCGKEGGDGADRDEEVVLDEGEEDKCDDILEGDVMLLRERVGVA